MLYILMHKNTKVLKADIYGDSIIKVEESYDLSHLPIGISYEDKKVNIKDLSEWWRRKSIPSTRKGIKNLMNDINLPSQYELIEKCLGLSLSDQYWIKPVNSNLQWKDINFFDNAFSEDVGDLLVDGKVNSNELNFMSPDSTTEGNLMKRWKIIDGKRVLLKAGSAPYYQEPFNEIIASIIMDKLNIPHVNYSLYYDNERPFCVCEDFIDSNHDFVSAWKLFKTKDTKGDSYEHLVSIAKEKGISNIVKDLDRMLVVDFLIVNVDRHLNNFGFIRNVETLKLEGFAPIFDSGSSLFFNEPTERINILEYPDWRPFQKLRKGNQLEYVSDFSWINIEALNDIYKDIKEVFSKSVSLKEERINIICSIIKNRIETLKGFIK